MAPLHSLLEHFPQVSLVDRPTPIQRLEGLEHSRGLLKRGIKLFAKRDDYMALGGGGNKLRKLEFHLGEALRDKVDVVVPMGGLQSNHARLTAAACAKLGMRCELVLGRAVPRDDEEYEHNGNMLLDELFGAVVHIVPEGFTTASWADTRAQELQMQGCKVKVIPTGGSTALGGLGYAKAALEIARQEASMGLKFTHMVMANGSSGTHAGMAAGFAAMGRAPGFIKSFAVLAEAPESHRRTLELTRQTLELLGSEQVIEPPMIAVDGAHRGAGYGVPTKAMLSALQLMARSEGLLLDPVYSGKAFAGLVADLESGLYAQGDNILLLMTGGAPGIFAYRSALQGA